MNWSITTWAPFAKSPNCASQIVKVSGSTKLYPYSNPSTASSDKKLSTISNFFCFVDTWSNGTYLELSIWFRKTECLWLNVPRPLSWPTNLTGNPSSSNVANARVSALAQSIFFSSCTHLSLFSKTFCIVLWILSSGFKKFIFAESFFNFVVSTPVCPLLSLPFFGWYLDQVPSNQFSFGL